jgi:hypothetical protein
MPNGEIAVPIDDQPVDATFFGEVRRLTAFITPNALEVQELYNQITKNLDNSIDKITACWKWVATQVKYVKFVNGKLWIGSALSLQKDLWTLPETTINTRVGNCAVKSFLLASLLRNELPPDQVYCVLGNLYNGKPGGHAWVGINWPDGEYVVESTMATAPAMVPINSARRYEAVHYFNDEQVLAVEGRTVMTPFTACFSTWLSDYLHWAYMESKRVSS